MYVLNEENYINYYCCFKCVKKVNKYFFLNENFVICIILYC